MMVFCWANSRLANEQELWVQWDPISRVLEMRVAFSWVTSAQTAEFAHFHCRLAPRFVQLSIQWKSSMRANSSFGPREACQGPGLPSLVNASVEIVLFDVVCILFWKWGTAAVKTHSSFSSCRTQPKLSFELQQSPQQKQHPACQASGHQWGRLWYHRSSCSWPVAFHRFGLLGNHQATHTTPT